LSEALAFASPEDLREKDIIKVRIRISRWWRVWELMVVYQGMVLEVSHLSGPAVCADTMGDSRSGSIAFCSRISTTVAAATAYN
jgi:hypothetical protein